VVIVASATDRDVPAISALLEEMDRFYGETEFEPADGREAQVRAMLFGKTPVAQVELAFASYSFLCPAAGLTHSLYLKELYVAEAYRRGGVGQALMQRLTDLAREEGCSRVEWTTDEPNQEAKAFYARLGLEVHQGKVFYRVTLH
jgi:GNAT superfamily N-acetyltransferase